MDDAEIVLYLKFEAAVSKTEDPGEQDLTDNERYAFKLFLNGSLGYNYATYSNLPLAKRILKPKRLMKSKRSSKFISNYCSELLILAKSFF